MDLYEYQARDLFRAHGVPVLDGATAATPEQAREVAAGLLDAGSSLVVVKAQVKTGGRGKAGGVKLARSALEAERRAREILGMNIKGHTVRTVLICAGADIDSEFYVSILLDRAERRYLAMCSREGGMDIETLAEERPEALARIAVDPLTGITDEVAAGIVEAAGFEPGLTAARIADVITRLWEVFTAEDATLVEVNPLAAADGAILALDGKVSLDDNAAFRHPEHAAFRDIADADPLEARARDAGLNYVRLEGQVGVLGNGAGLVMSTLDVIADADSRIVQGVGRLEVGIVAGAIDHVAHAVGVDLSAQAPRIRLIPEDRRQHPQQRQHEQHIEQHQRRQQVMAPAPRAGGHGRVFEQGGHDGKRIRAGHGAGRPKGPVQPTRPWRPEGAAPAPTGGRIARE